MNDLTELKALLERFGIRYDTFAQLRPDSYLHALASHSMEELELVLSLLVQPGLTLEQAREECPVWPEGTRLAGKLPGKTALGEIGTLLRTEQALAGLQEVGEFIDRVKGKMADVPGAQTSGVLDSVCALIGQELVAEKMAGTPLTGRLEVVDRLLNKETLERETLATQVRAKQKERDQELKAEQIEINRQKFQRDTCKLFLKWFADQQAKTIATGPSSNTEKIEQLGQLMFGEEWS